MVLRGLSAFASVEHRQDLPIHNIAGADRLLPIHSSKHGTGGGISAAQLYEHRAFSEVA